jgi:hypothetical protein
MVYYSFENTWSNHENIPSGMPPALGWDMNLAEILVSP